MIEVNKNNHESNQEVNKETIESAKKLDNLQSDLIHESLGKLDVKSEHKSDLAEMKKEIKEIKEEHEEEVEDQEDFVEDWRDVVEDVLPDLDNYIEDKCLEKLKYLHLSYGFIWDKHQIKRLLTRTQNVFLEQSKESKDKGQVNKEFSDIFDAQILDEVFAWLDESDGSISDEEVFAILVLLAQEYENLEEEKKKKLILWIQEKIAFIKEGKLLEVYEIQIGADGTVTMKGNVGGKPVVIIYSPGSDEFEIS